MFKSIQYGTPIHFTLYSITDRIKQNKEELKSHVDRMNENRFLSPIKLVMNPKEEDLFRGGMKSSVGTYKA